MFLRDEGTRSDGCVCGGIVRVTGTVVEVGACTAWRSGWAFDFIGAIFIKLIVGVRFRHILICPYSFDFFFLRITGMKDESQDN